jgi:hypothetical protein
MKNLLSDMKLVPREVPECDPISYNKYHFDFKPCLVDESVGNKPTLFHSFQMLVGHPFKYDSEVVRYQDLLKLRELRVRVSTYEQ